MKREHKILFTLNALYLVPLFFIFFMQGKWEFLAYIGQMIILLGVLAATIHKTRFPVWLLMMLSLWAVLHVAGGAIPVGDGVLYGYRFFHIVGSEDGYVLRYDQVVHFFGFFTATFVAYWLMLPQFKRNFRLGVAAFVAALAGMGFGAVNEIIEFGAVLAVEETGVGGYLNTAIDLVANGIGATAAAMLIVQKKIGLSATFEESRDVRS